MPMDAPLEKRRVVGPIGYEWHFLQTSLSKACSKLNHTAMETKFSIKDIPSLLKETYKSWSNNDPFDQSATVAYYSIFSLPALLIIIVTIAGIALGREAVQQIAGQIGGMIGGDAAKEVQEMIANSFKKSNQGIALVVGF